MLHAIDAAASLDGPIVHSEDHGITLVQRNDLDPALASRPLLRQHELATGKILGIRQKHRHLQGEGERSVKILVEAIVIAGPVAKEEGRGAQLTSAAAAFEEFVERRRIAYVSAAGMAPRRASATIRENIRQSGGPYGPRVSPPM